MRSSSSRFDLGEADRVLTLITPEQGKSTRSRRGSGGRRRASAAASSRSPSCSVALARGRTFEVITQVVVGHAWLRLRDSLESAATAWYLAELADRSLEERHAAEPLYLLLRRGYELLDAGMAPGRVARWYEMHLADELGVRPEVDRCAECDRMLEPDRHVPLGAGSAGACDRCGRRPGELSLEALKLLKAYQRLDARPSPGCGWRDRWSARSSGAARVRAPLLERDPRSLAFLDEVRLAHARPASRLMRDREARRASRLASVAPRDFGWRAARRSLTRAEREPLGRCPRRNPGCARREHRARVDEDSAPRHRRRSSSD